MSKIQSLVFTLTVFLSAYLLFVVQPIVGKVILPILGGTPSVWNTTMMFFQLILLGGYFYAHSIAKIKSLKIQFATHIGFLLLAGVVTLPMITDVSQINTSETSQNPLFWQVKTMISMICLPFLFLSATAPLLQRWFSHTNHRDAENPYFLYSASNLGSVLALVFYPIVVERFLPLPEQSIYWTCGYVALLIFMIGSSWIAYKNLKAKDETEEGPIMSVTKDAPSTKTILTWLLLAFVPSSMMLGYTSYITSDVGSLPLFWVIPLTLYILSFVIAFSKKPLIPLAATRVVYAILAVLIFTLMGSIFLLKLEIGIALGVLFFFTALMCHQELVRLKPSPEHLTLFYLVMSLGGALGGVFNALIAPVIFVKTYEFMIVLILSLFCWNISSSLSFTFTKDNKKHLIILALTGILASASFLVTQFFRSELLLFLPFIGMIAIPMVLFLMDKKPYFITACLMFILTTPLTEWSEAEKVVDTSRNYFGTLTTSDSDLTRNIFHGITLHGSQPLDQKYKTIPLTYFNQKTAIGQAFATVEEYRKDIVAGGLGLGAGSVTCLLRSEDKITFYEIDPDVIRVASDPKFFSYLHDCPPKSDIIQGDARLELRNAPDHAYDLLLVDVFSSDSIPLHLLTKEAVELYLQKTKPDGLVIFHLSSRSFKLTPEVGQIADALGVPAYGTITEFGDIEGTKYTYNASVVNVMTKNQDYIESLKKKGWVEVHGIKDRAPWTDTYVNPLRAIYFGAYVADTPVATSSQKSE